jgi:hypothetical protein
MAHIQVHPRKESVYYIDAYRDYQSLQRHGKNVVVNSTKDFVNKQTKNLSIALEDFELC